MSRITTSSRKSWNTPIVPWNFGQEAPSAVLQHTLGSEGGARGKKCNFQFQKQPCVCSRKGEGGGEFSCIYSSVWPSSSWGHVTWTGVLPLFTCPVPGMVCSSRLLGKKGLDGPFFCKGRRSGSVLSPSFNTWEFYHSFLKVRLNTIFKPAWVRAPNGFHKMSPFSLRAWWPQVPPNGSTEFLPFVVGKPRAFSEI